MKDWLRPEGPVFDIVDKAGQLVLLSLLWLLGCVPIVTIVTSSTALYYAVMKSIRRGRGDAVKEFWHSYRENLRRGIPITLTALVLGGLVYINIRLCAGNGINVQNLLLWGNCICMAVLVMVLTYVCPVLSRFDMRVRDVWKLSFVMAIRFLPYTLVIALGTGAMVLLQIFVLPMPTVVILPGAWCLATTFLVEKALCKFMPEKTPEDDAWYYE